MRGIERNGSQKNHPSTQISIEKASLITLLDAAVYLVEDIPVRRGGGVEVVIQEEIRGVCDTTARKEWSRFHECGILSV